MAASVSPNESAAKRATACSRPWACTAAVVTASQHSAHRTMRLKSPMRRPGMDGGGGAPPPLWFSQCGSARAAAPLADLVVVAALEGHPVGDQILGAFEIGRPRVAGHEAFGLPHYVELAVSPHLADEDRLGDVMVGQHFRRA